MHIIERTHAKLDVRVVLDPVPRQAHIKVNWAATVHILFEIGRASRILSNHPVGPELVSIGSASPHVVSISVNVAIFGPDRLFVQAPRESDATRIVVVARVPLQPHNTKDEEHEHKKDQNVQQPDYTMNQRQNLLSQTGYRFHGFQWSQYSQGP